MENQMEAAVAGEVEREVDVIVLGVGTCGEDLSLRLLRAGLEVVGIEAALVGGACAYWACLPSKRMLRAAELLQEAKRADGMAGRTNVVPDWNLVAAQIRNEVTGGWNDSNAVKRFESHGGTLIHGHGRLTGPRTVTVNERSFRARKGVVIATGSRAFVPPIPGLNEVDYWISNDVIKAEALPESLIILGGGAIGCELGQLVSRFGTRVTIVEGAERLLPGEEPETSAVLARVFEGEGIRVLAGRRARRVQGSEEAVKLHLDNGESVTAERLLVATGRTIDLAGLGLENAGLDPEAPFIPVDAQMRAADGVWAMGDVTGPPMFTHVALYQSAIVAADILEKMFPPAQYHAVPRATYTDPEVGAVGLTEAQAREQGLQVVSVVKQLPATFRGWLHGAGEGFIKFVADGEHGILLGATAVGPRGAEMLGFLSLAVQARIPIIELQSMIYAFPSFYGAIGEGLGAYGRGLMAAMDPTYDGFEDLDKAGRPG